jgi:predicted GIY-YIG superfamily endonuclease
MGGNMSRGHQFAVVERNKKWLAVMILSEHDNMDEALKAAINAMDIESEEIMKELIEEERAKGVDAVTVEEAIKDMNPEELERFIEERQRKFVNPLLYTNIKTLEDKRKRLKIKRIK